MTCLKLRTRKETSIAIQFLHALCNCRFDLGNLARKRNCGEEAELEEATAVAPCKIPRASEEEADGSNVLSTNLPSLSTPCEHPITKEKKVVAAALLPSAEKTKKLVCL